MPARKQIILNTKDTANILGISARAFAEWGIEPVNKKGTQVFYDLKKVIAYWKDKDKKKEKPLTEERTRLTRIQADKAEYELELFKNKLHDAKVIKSVWSDQILRFRARLLAMPAKLSLNLCNKTEPNKIELIIRKEVLEVLDELQKYKSSDYTITDDSLLTDDSENEIQQIPKKAASKKTTKKKKAASKKTIRKK